MDFNDPNSITNALLKNGIYDCIKFVAICLLLKPIFARARTLPAIVRGRLHRKLGGANLAYTDRWEPVLRTVRNDFAFLGYLLLLFMVGAEIHGKPWFCQIIGWIVVILAWILLGIACYDPKAIAEIDVLRTTHPKVATIIPTLGLVFSLTVFVGLLLAFAVALYSK
jgi:hypothetical protein